MNEILRKTNQLSMKIKFISLAMASCLLLAPINSSYAWWGSSNSYSSQDTSYDGRSYSLSEFRSMKGYEAPKVEVKPSFWSNVGNFFSKIGSAISTAISKTWDFAKNIATSIKEFFVKTPEVEQTEISTATMSGYVTRIDNSQPELKNDDSNVQNNDNVETVDFAANSQETDVRSAESVDVVTDDNAGVEGKVADSHASVVLDTASKVEMAVEQSPVAQSKDVALANMLNKVGVDVEMFNLMPDSHKAQLLRMVSSENNPSSAKQESYFDSAKFKDSKESMPYFGAGAQYRKADVLAKVANDFKNHVEFEPNLGRHVEAVKDIGTRGAKIAASTATGNVVGKATTNLVGTVAGAVIGDVLDSGKPQAQVIQNDRVEFAEVAKLFNSYVDVMAVPNITIEVNPITHIEAINRNNDDRKTSFWGGMFPFYGNILGAVKTQPFVYGQNEYKVKAFENPRYGPVVLLEYRTGDFVNNENKVENSVVAAKFVVREYDPIELVWRDKEFEYAPK